MESKPYEASASMSTSYQKALGPRPQKIEELGLSPEELAKKKKRKQLFFIGTTAALLVIFGVLAWELRGHQDEDHNIEVDEALELGKVSLAALDARTNTSVVTGCETTILVMRHCEKEGNEKKDQDENQHCSYVGAERAAFLPSLFGQGGWPVPSLLYALSPDRGDHLNFREVETLVPLARKHGLKIRKNFTSNSELSKDFFERVASGNMCGKVALASWNHEMIGDLAKTLGCPDCPRDFPESSFDEVWQLKYVYHVKGTEVAKANNGETSSDRRKLTKKYHHKKHRKKQHSIPEKPSKWSLYSSVTQQNFDPLKFSFSVGDYSGSESGGKWFTMDEGEM